MSDPAQTPENALRAATLHVSDFLKPDGRSLTLYGLSPVTVSGEIPAPEGSIEPRPLMRWHPLRSEWVMYAAHRLERTFLPPAHFNPLAPTTDPEHPTELPQGNYDIAVFQNRFPSLSLTAPEPTDAQIGRAGHGACEVVVFSQQSEGRLADLNVPQMELLLRVWADRTNRLAAAGLKSVLCFENRGIEVGVTLHHPHGQIYAYDHIPPVQETTLESMKAYREKTGRAWLPDFISEMNKNGKYIVLDKEKAMSVVPPFARYSYETWILPTRPVRFLSELSDIEIASFACCLKDALIRLDELFGVPMPYLLTVHQAPLNTEGGDDFPLHIEIYPYLRAAGKLKYLAGTEQGAGEFANDKLPEIAATELRNFKGVQNE